MPDPQLILDILWNSFAANILFSFRSEQIIYAMVAFKIPALAVPLILSVIGGAVAQFVHYLFGTYLEILWKQYDWWLEEAQYDKLQKIIRRYGVWMLLIFMFPLYPVIPMIMGFFRVRPGFVVLLLVLAQMAQKLWEMYLELHLLHFN